MAPSSNTENGVSSCGGRLVSPIIGRFCGYLTSGRSPFSNGMVTVSSASAFVVPNVPPAPRAQMPAPAPLMSFRRSSTGVLLMAFTCWGRVERFLLAQTRLLSCNGVTHDPEILTQVPVRSLLGRQLY